MSVFRGNDQILPLLNDLSRDASSRCMLFLDGHKHIKRGGK